MHDQTPRQSMHDDPRLPPLVLSDPIELNTLRDKPMRETRSETHLERRAQLAGALDEIRSMDVDRAELRAQCGRQEAEIARQASYIAFLEVQCRTMDQERMRYMRVAVGLAKQLKSIHALCEEGSTIAQAAEQLPEEANHGALHPLRQHPSNHRPVGRRDDQERHRPDGAEGSNRDA